MASDLANPSFFLVFRPTEEILATTVLPPFFRNEKGTFPTLLERNGFSLEVA